jgi:hypothetical protein
MRCRCCGIRWAQQAGLCRTCQALPGDQRRDAERERDRRRGVDRPVLHVQHDPTPTPLRTLTVRGVDYDVLWDGSDGSAVGQRYL